MGLGESQGRFSDSHFSANVQDLISAAGYLSEKILAPAVLIGHSLGGAACLVAAPKLQSVKTVVTIGAPANTQHLAQTIEQQSPEHDTPTKEIVLAGRRFAINNDFVKDLQQQNMKEVIRRLKKPLLLFHSPVDQTVPIDHAKEIYKLASHPKSFISLDQADHLLSDPKDAAFVADMTAIWVKRYID